jgi:hypothetical protein
MHLNSPNTHRLDGVGYGYACVGIGPRIDNQPVIDPVGRLNFVNYGYLMVGLVKIGLYPSPAA